MTRKPGNILIVFALFALLSFSLFSGHCIASDANSKKALLIIAYKDFNNSEYSVTKDMLETHGIAITVASSQKGKATSMELEVPVDRIIDQVNVSGYDAIVFIGGFGVFDEYVDNPKAEQIVQAAVKQKKILAGICAATGVIYGADVIEYKLPAPTPPGKNVRIEGNIILGGGPNDARFFAETIVQAMDETISRR